MKKYEKNLHSQFETYGRNAKDWMKKCILLLPAIDRHRIWEKKGFHSIYEYAAKLAGMSRDKVNEGLRIMKKVEDKPNLRRVVEEKGFLAIRPVACIATKENEEFWAEKAKTMTARTLETYVKEYKNRLHVKAQSGEGLTKTEENCKTPALTIQITDPALAQTLKDIKGPQEWDNLIKKLLRIREKHLKTATPAPVHTHSRPIPAKIDSYVRARSLGTCEFGHGNSRCHKKATIMHHTERFALRKTHDPDKIVHLCEEHEKIAHLGLIMNENAPPSQWKVRERADKTDLRQVIDLRVQKFRSPQQPQSHHQPQLAAATI